MLHQSLHEEYISFILTINPYACFPERQLFQAEFALSNQHIMWLDTFADAKQVHNETIMGAWSCRCKIRHFLYLFNWKERGGANNHFFFRFFSNHANGFLKAFDIQAIIVTIDDVDRQFDEIAFESSFNYELSDGFAV